MPLTFSFDIGYASIGWSVLEAQADSRLDPEFLGTGVVTFPTDDCLASQRRGLRRVRRNIRSTRQRIERLKRWFLHQGILSREELDQPGHAAPFLLAAASLQGLRTLTAWELWTVLRWYAHNRGYDGNSRWSRQEATSDDEGDTAKEEAARALMRKHNTATMAATVCKCLDLDISEHSKTISSFLPYKTLDAAYPRPIVEKEVHQLVHQHLGKIAGFDAAAARLILKTTELTDDERKLLSTAGIKLAKSYSGGLLFGQLVPRFDNRIISRCPITYAEKYDTAIADGKTEKEAAHQAEKLAKVPAAKCPEFLQYRFARILANLKANSLPLPKELRAILWQLAEKNGRLTHKDLEREIKGHCGNVPTNIDAYFTIHPDSEDALIFDPVMDEVRKAEGAGRKLKPIWKLLPEKVQSDIIFQWRKGKAISLAQILEKTENDPQLIPILEKEHAALKPRKGKPVPSLDSYLLNTRISADFPSGRAAYARPVLKKVVEEVLAGFDPNKPARSTLHPAGEDKENDGVLYSLLDPKSRVRELQDARPLDILTNNHLVRHRLLILDRLLDDMITEFCAKGETVESVVVEVARELKEFSGKTAKEISSELSNRLKDFKSAVDHLKKEAPHFTLSGNLIRKCRIAMDMNWQCPFTGGGPYDVTDLPDLEREHIIPYATRNTNALHALVLTWPAVNRMKGKRTARQFIKDHEGQQVVGMPNLSLFTLKQYDAFVDKLDTKGHLDDFRRKKARKAMLATTDFEDKELGFTPGALTQSSHLMKLAMRSLKAKLPSALCDPIPGPVTAEIRKAWNLIGTLSLASPEIIDPSDGKPRPKDEIRAITHLHHAVDAATIALAAHYFPLQRYGLDQKGKIWQALLKRNRTPDEVNFLHKLGIFDGYIDKNGKPNVKLRDLSADLKNQLARSLAECRVMQHVPADRSGTKAELTTWGIVGAEGEGEETRVKLRQRTSKVENGKRVLAMKNREERAGKLLGPNPKGGKGKLAAIKGAMIIGENYGLALDPTPTVIPFHDVTATLKSLQQANGGKPVRVLRNGMLIKIRTNPARSQQDYTGMWRVTSIKNNKSKYLLDMIRPGYVTARNGVIWSGMNKSIGPLLECGLEISPQLYTGHVAEI